MEKKVSTGAHAAKVRRGVLTTDKLQENVARLSQLETQLRSILVAVKAQRITALKIDGFKKFSAAENLLSEHIRLLGRSIGEHQFSQDRPTTPESTLPPL